MPGKKKLDFFVKNNKSRNPQLGVKVNGKGDKMNKIHKIGKKTNICLIPKIVYEYIDFAAITFVITAWSLILLVKGSARLRVVSTNLTVMPTWSTHFLTLSSKCWFILSTMGRTDLSESIVV